MGPEVFRQVLILTGPTGSGKSQLGIELARGLDAEIISMDSMALYRGMDIGIAKPTREERARIPHHLLDVLDPWESANVAWWLDQAGQLTQEIESRGKRVLLVGGTPLYLKALLFGLCDSPPGDESVRRRLEQEGEQEGQQHLHGRLATVDPVSAARLHVNDLRRVVRALEVWELTGRPLSSWQTQWSGTEDREGVSDVPRRCLCLDLPRATLYERINRRVERMIEQGLVEEVQALRNLKHPLSREASQALGYKEMFSYLEGRASLAETVAVIQKRSRHFAKRQLTWFRHLPGCTFVSPELTFSFWGLTMER
jgi:tRNA dimethylallyltransferase